jgi:NTP pyrophosphatase (non-canonical NTP hydrolase)
MENIIVNSWNDYQNQAKNTAIYPPEQGIVYTTLGLIDETIELMNADHHNRLKELGDCFWYLANWCREVGFSFGDIEYSAYEFSSQEVYNLQTLAIDDMLKSAGNICGLIKKWLRDEGGMIISEERLMELEAECVFYTNAAMQLCLLLGSSVNKVMVDNLDKLFSRKKRGKLKGSGDNR